MGENKMGLKKLEVKTIEFNGKLREFRVVDRNVGSPAPKYFISYGNGTPFISDEVPENYRNPMVFRELTEFELLQNESDRCLKALNAELEIVPENLRKDYVLFRREVFESLIDYFKHYQPDSPFISEAGKSLDKLKTL